jgi:predicted RNA-binding Zn ribbon-like protein
MEFTGGHPGIDFVNTLGGLPGHADDEFLHEFSDLLPWLQRSGLGSAGDVQTARRAVAEPEAAARVLAAVRDLRASTDQLLRSRLRGGRPATADLDRIRDACSEAVAHASLRADASRFRWSWDQVDPDELRRPLWMITGTVLDLLTEAPLDLLGGCARCRFLFLDTSRNHSRRWCSMRSCGAISKMRRYRAAGNRGRPDLR